MYTIEVESTNKIIRINLSGHMSFDEIGSYTKELRQLLIESEVSAYSILICAELLDPVPQDSLPLFIDCMKYVLIKAKKIAAVHKRVVTQMQCQKIERAAASYYGLTQRIERFSSMKDALRYINRP